MQVPFTATHGSGDGVKVARRAAATCPANENKARSLDIAVADDDPVRCREHLEMLSRLGHRVCQAHTGRQLVDQCRLVRPDLVITAIQLPALDGIAAAEEICRDQLTPIILMQGDPDVELVERALDNPCILAWLSLPIKETDLRLAIAFAMRRFQQFELLRKEAADLRQTLEERKFIERAKGMVMRYAGLDEQEAFRRLRKMASDQNRKLADVAQVILTAGQVFDALGPAGEGRK